MNKQIKTKLQFILGGILLVTFAVASCNNNSEADKADAKDTTATEVKTAVPEQPVRDSMDTANEAPTPNPN